MTDRNASGSCKQESRSPVEVARLSRLDYASTATQEVADQVDLPLAKTARRAASLARSKAVRGGAVLTPVDLDVLIASPQQVRVEMRSQYARELLGQLRSARELRPGECAQITIDCPVEIVMDAPTCVALISKLGAELGE